MTKDMKDKVAIVTGASSGIGRATALAFARQGAKVIVNANANIKGGEETVHLIEEAGGQAIDIKADVSIASEVEAMVDKAVETYGRLDYAFNNAGIMGAIASVTSYPEEKWDRVLNVNLKGMWLCMKYEIPQMLRVGKGAIVNNSSIEALGGIPNFVAYAASKHGAIGLTQVAAVEYAKAGIRINAVCPGIILTNIVRNIFSDLETARMAQKPIERLGKPEEVASVVTWLCSDAASFVTGQAITVDGGKVINIAGTSHLIDPVLYKDS